MTADSPYRTPNAFWSAVDAKLKAQARRDGCPFAELRREFLYQRFLARIFHQESLWVLKGGIGLLTRLPGARHSRDIDLMHLTATPADAEAEVRAIGRRRHDRLDKMWTGGVAAWGTHLWYNHWRRREL